MSNACKVIATNKKGGQEIYSVQGLENAMKKRQQLIASGKYIIVEILQK